jgi:hypothetical protein
MARGKAINKESRRYLPRGYGETIAKQFGCSVSKVYHVVTGRLVDYRIMEALLDLIEKNVSIERRLYRRNGQVK